MLVLAGFGISTLTLRLCQYINLLIDEYSLRVLPKKKSIIGLDDLYLLLYTHWVLDNSTFKNKRQRVQVAIDLLTIAFFDCRLCFLFDIRVKFDDLDDSNISTNNTVVASSFGARKVVDNVKIDEIKNIKSNCNSNTEKSIDAACEIDGDCNKPWSNNSDSDSDSDSDSLYSYKKNSDIDNDCNAEFKVTRLFLYCHFTINIVVNRTSGKSNLIFIKATLLYTKEKNNNLRI